MRARLVTVRLSEVPLRLRRRAGGPLIAAASRRADLKSAIELKRAVLAPSEREYVVSAEARRRVLG